MNKKNIWQNLCLVLSMFTIHTIASDDHEGDDFSPLFTKDVDPCDIALIDEPMLQWLAGIAEQTNCSELRNCEQAQVRNKMMNILEHILKYISTHIKSSSKNIQNMALVCLKSWIQFGVPLEHIYANDYLLSCVFDCLRDRDLFTASVDVLLEIVSDGGHSPTSHKNTVLKYMQQLCLLANDLYPNCIKYHDDEVCRELVNLIVGFAEAHIDMIHSNMNISNSPSTHLVNLIVQIAHHPNHDISELTFPFWYTFSYNVHDYYNDNSKLLLMNFVNTMIAQLQIKNDVDEESWQKYRADASEALFSCHNVLCADYFVPIQRTLQCTAHTSWQMIESSLYVCCAASDSVKSNSLLPIIPQIVKIANANPNSNPIQSAILRFISLYTSHLRDYGGEAIVWSLKYAMDGISRGDLLSSKCFVNLCELSVDDLNAKMIFMELCKCCISQLDALGDGPICFNVYQALGHICASMQDEPADQLKTIGDLLNPIVDKMLLPSHAKFEMLNVQINKFKSCVKAFERASDSQLAVVVANLWPKIQHLLMHFVHDANIEKILCELVKTIVLSAGDECIGESFIKVGVPIYNAKKEYGFVLDVMGTIVDGHKNDAIFNAFAPHFVSIVSQSLSFVEEGGGGQLDDLVEGLYSLLGYVFQTSPELFVSDADLCEKCLLKGVEFLENLNPDVNKKICSFFEIVLKEVGKRIAEFDKLIWIFSNQLALMLLKLILLHQTASDNHMIRLLGEFSKFPMMLKVSAQNALLNPEFARLSDAEKNFLCATLWKSHGGVTKIRNIMRDYKLKLQ
ncbi:Ipo13 [Acrasis kona]|uniref:Ipo13 n=1 Tax=Acrasis kona TaxID=1008807 RepID=A0AAW2YTK3_9EUKA